MEVGVELYLVKLSGFDITGTYNQKIFVVSFLWLIILYLDSLSFDECETLNREKADVYEKNDERSMSNSMEEELRNEDTDDGPRNIKRMINSPLN